MMVSSVVTSMPDKQPCRHRQPARRARASDGRGAVLKELPCSHPLLGMPAPATGPSLASHLYGCQHLGLNQAAQLQGDITAARCLLCVARWRAERSMQGAAHAVRGHLLHALQQAGRLRGWQPQVRCLSALLLCAASAGCRCVLSGALAEAPAAPGHQGVCT